MRTCKSATLETIMGLTAFAAGAVDIISFTRLGGIFASAMTGNLAFMALYLARGSINSAVGSVLALLGFMAGTAAAHLLTRQKTQQAALNILLGMETALLAGVVCLWVAATPVNGGWRAGMVIVLLSVAMGTQIIAGKRLNLSNIPTIVFTSTLSNFVAGLSDTLAARKFTLSEDSRRQCAAFILYFLGALVAGLMADLELGALIVLPLVAVMLALLIHVFLVWSKDGK
jgi:uncharacterized membrane protein YoaK (UPF0700 family)